MGTCVSFTTDRYADGTASSTGTLLLPDIPRGSNGTEPTPIQALLITTKHASDSRDPTEPRQEQYTVAKLTGTAIPCSS